MKRPLRAAMVMAAGSLMAGIWAFGQDPAFRAQPATPVSSAPAAVPRVLNDRPPIGIEVPARVMDDGIQRRERELTVEAMDLVNRFGQTKDPTAQADLQKELTRAVETHFALRQELRAKELRELEEQIKRLQKIHEQRTAEKDRIVAERVNQLLRDASGLGWGTDVNSPKGEYLYTPRR